MQTDTRPKPRPCAFLNTNRSGDEQVAIRGCYARPQAHRASTDIAMIPTVNAATAAMALIKELFCICLL